MWMRAEHAKTDNGPTSKTPIVLLGPGDSADGVLIQEIGWCDPANLFAGIVDQPGIAFLDSAATADPRGRFSYICIDPAGDLIVEGAADAGVFDRLRALTKGLPVRSTPLPFAGGIVGMIGYDVGRERLGVSTRHRACAAPACVARVYDFVIGFDHLAGRAYAIVGDRAGVSARSRLARWQTLARRGATLRNTAVLDWTECTGFDAYRQAFGEIAAYLHAGDLYQANFSTLFVAPRPATFDPVNAYLRLRSRSPNPFGAFLDLGADRYLLSASPERFVCIDADGLIETRPIKGTAPRLADPDADRLASERLLASVKDRSENLMICDLLRNDLAKVSLPGSVRVTKLAGIERFASVWHLVSAIEARLEPERDAVDVLEALIPGGSITGAPKKRAAEIIDELEDVARGPFFGTIFRLGGDGALDSAIVIRSMLIDRQDVTARAGGGILAESEAAAEYAELCLKVAPLLAATRALEEERQ